MTKRSLVGSGKPRRTKLPKFRTIEDDDSLSTRASNSQSEQTLWFSLYHSPGGRLRARRRYITVETPKKDDRRSTKAADVDEQREVNEERVSKAVEEKEAGHSSDLRHNPVEASSREGKRDTRPPQVPKIDVEVRKDKVARWRRRSGRLVRESEGM